MLIAAGGAFLLLKTVMVLSVTNRDHPGSFHFKEAISEQVILRYSNSMYEAPVEEVFEVRDGEIILKAIRTDSPAVREYYGFEGTQPVHALHKSLGPNFSIRVSMRQDQGFRIGQRTLDLRAIARAGDRILVSVNQVSLARFLWWEIIRKGKIDLLTKD